MYDIFIDGISLYSLGIYVIKRPDFPSPKKKYKEVDIIGIDGKLYQDTGLYEDMDIQIEFNYMGEVDLWHSIWRKAKKILLSHIKELSCSDDSDMFYKIKKVEIGTNERTSYRIGKFNVTFTVDPYTYLVSGKGKLPLLACYSNFYEKCKPIYYIKGEGLLEFSVNGKHISVNVGQNLIIDTDRKISYRENGILNNVALSGDYEDLYFVEGNNTVEIVNGNNFEITIQPNWRCI